MAKNTWSIVAIAAVIGLSGWAVYRYFQTRTDVQEVKQEAKTKRAEIRQDSRTERVQIRQENRTERVETIVEATKDIFKKKSSSPVYVPPTVKITNTKTGSVSPIDKKNAVGQAVSSTVSGNPLGSKISLLASDPMVKNLAKSNVLKSQSVIPSMKSVVLNLAK